MRKRAVLFILLVLSGCDGGAATTAPPTAAVPSPQAAVSPAPWAAPPLRLPRIDPGEPCPTTARQPWTGPGVAAAVLGDGPLHPVADYFRAGTVLELREQDRHADGTYEVKVRWIGARYTGPVLVRVGRIDGNAAASARFSYVGQERDGGYYTELTEPFNDLPATTTVGGPGCYAYQIDGASFSTTVVFRAA